MLERKIIQTKFSDPKIGYCPLAYYMTQHGNKTPEQVGEGHKRTMVEGEPHVIVPEAPIKYLKSAQIRQAQHFASDCLTFDICHLWT